MPAPTWFPEKLTTLTGKSTLNLPWQEGQTIFDCESSITCERSKTNAHFIVKIFWEHEGVAQEGLVVGGIPDEGDEIHAVFFDSWHQRNSPLKMTGTASVDSFTVKGTYYEDADGAWSWRIEMSPIEGGLKLEMTNIEPSGNEEWAVRAEYRN